MESGKGAANPAEPAAAREFGTANPTNAANSHPILRTPVHPGVVEDLAGLGHAWTIAVINDELGKQTGSNNLTPWHDRWLWPCLRRMKTEHYRTTNCGDHKHPETGNTQPTDRNFLPALAG